MHVTHFAIGLHRQRSMAWLGADSDTGQIESIVVVEIIDRQINDRRNVRWNGG